MLSVVQVRPAATDTHSSLPTDCAHSFVKFRMVQIPFISRAMYIIRIQQLPSLYSLTLRLMLSLQGWCHHVAIASQAEAGRRFPYIYHDNVVAPNQKKSLLLAEPGRIFQTALSDTSQGIVAISAPCNGWGLLLLYHIQHARSTTLWISISAAHIQGAWNCAGYAQLCAFRSPSAAHKRRRLSPHLVCQAVGPVELLQEAGKVLTGKRPQSPFHTGIQALVGRQYVLWWTSLYRIQYTQY